MVKKRLQQAFEVPSSGLPQPQIAQFFQGSLVLGSLVLLIYNFQNMEDAYSQALERAHEGCLCQQQQQHLEGG